MKLKKIVLIIYFSFCIITLLTGCSDNIDKECKADISSYFDEFIKNNSFNDAMYNIELTSITDDEYKIHSYKVNFTYNDFDDLGNDKMLEIVNMLYDDRSEMCDGITYVDIVCNDDIYSKDIVYENVLLKNDEELYVLGGKEKTHSYDTSDTNNVDADSSLVNKGIGGREKDAWVCAQDVVENNLKSPSTADFPWYSDEYITFLGDDKYMVTAYVDAENSFGATIRSDFTVTLILTQSGYEDASCSIE